MKNTQTKNLLTARDKYLRKKFEITEAEYEAQLASQGGGCKICGKTHNKKGEPLIFHVDHDHRVEGQKIFSKRWADGKGWNAWTGDSLCIASNRLKSAAIAAVRKMLRRKSCRGILCWMCNTSLKKFNDNPVLMQNSATYILSYLEKVKQGRNGFE